MREFELDLLAPPERRLRVRSEVVAVLREERAILSASAVTEVVNQVSDEVVGLGPIERLLKDPEVSEVMVNGADDVYVERKGPIDILRVYPSEKDDHESGRLRKDLQARRTDHQPGAATPGD
jgi:Flp pilus assembly CpaF family ATPase